MNYPYDFPATSRDKIEVEKIRARRELEQKKATLGSSFYGPGEELEALVREYILRIVVTFATEAKNLGWGTARAREESLTLLRSLAILAPHEVGRDRSGHRIGDLTQGAFSTIRPNVQQKFENSPQWKRLEDVLLSVSDVHDGAPPKRPHVMRSDGSADNPSERGVLEPTASDKNRRGRPTLDEENNRIIAQVALRCGKDWKKRIEEVLSALDEVQAKVGESQKFIRRENACLYWSDQLNRSSSKEAAVKAVDTRVRWFTKQYPDEAAALAKLYIVRVQPAPKSSE